MFEILKEIIKTSKLEVTCEQEYIQIVILLDVSSNFHSEGCSINEYVKILNKTFQNFLNNCDDFFPAICPKRESITDDSSESDKEYYKDFNLHNDNLIKHSFSDGNDFSEFPTVLHSDISEKHEDGKCDNGLESKSEITESPSTVISFKKKVLKPSEDPNISRIVETEDKRNIECLRCLKRFQRSWFDDEHYKACSQKKKRPSADPNYARKLDIDSDRNIECLKCGKRYFRNYFDDEHYYYCNNLPCPKYPDKKRKKPSKFPFRNRSLAKILGRSRCECLNCGGVFTERQFNTKHYYECHNLPVPELKFPCDICGKIFSSSGNVEIHKKKHGDEVHYCDKCDFKTNTDTNLKKHMQKHSVRELFTCHICGKTVAHRAAHMRRVHEVSSEMKNCPHCDKQFEKKKLYNHISKVHTRNFPCSQCSYRAADNFNLKLHVSKMHLGKKDLDKFPCPHCGFLTTNVETHIRLNHPNLNLN